MQKVNELSAGTLAFVGDAVYGLLVRQRLAQVNRPIGELHRLSVTYVNANSQAEAFKIIEPHLTEEELAYFCRGKNAHSHAAPKSATPQEYAKATGLEALFGALYLAGKLERLNELFAIMMEEENGI